MEDLNKNNEASNGLNLRELHSYTKQVQDRKNKVDKIIQKPTAKEFIDGLQKSKPKILSRLEEKFLSQKKQSFLSQFDTFEEYIESEIYAFFHTGEQKNEPSGFMLGSDGEYETYTHIGDNQNSYQKLTNKKFMGYGIWASYDDIFGNDKNT